MDLRLSGKRALVTGSSSGIGEAIARILAREGAVVVVHGRAEERAAAVAERIRQEGGRAFVAVGDLAGEADAQRVCDAALAQTGGIDILVNNAGAYSSDDWPGATAGEWADIYNKNVLTAVRVLDRIVPQMRAAGWGRIVQMTSSLAVRPLRVLPAYSAAKAALLNLTSSLALELADSGITVNAIGAGLVSTPETRRHLAASASADRSDGGVARPRHRVFIPLGRPAEPDEIAAFVAFICSPLGGYVHGASLAIDGGYIGPSE